MNTRYVIRSTIAFLLIVCVAASQTLQNVENPPGGDPWPRQVALQGATIQIYQPQLEQWKGNQLDAFAAVSARTQGSNDTVYGVINH
jgi:hypothetical protein